MATSTSGGTTTSLTNTPQAKDDLYAATEDQILCFDVMANDLGGNAKTLWSIDDSATDTDGSTDLIAKDVAGVIEYSELGAKISLTSDGKIKYDTTMLDSLAEGEIATDYFTYAIRLSNGTLSWATVTVTLTGTNDAPVANFDTGSAGENEDKAFDVLANDTDVDAGAELSLDSIDGVTVDGGAASAAEAAAFAIGGGQIQFTPGTAFDHLAEGASATVVVSYTITDEHGASSSSTLTLTVTGTNDGPVANVDTGGTTENATVSVDVLANDTDADDGAVLSLASIDGVTVDGSSASPAEAAAFTIDGDEVKFTPGTAFDHLADGATATVVVSYTVEDEYGATSSSELTLTVTGTNDGPEAAATNSVTTDEDAASASTAIGATDVDDGDVLTYSVKTGAEPAHGDVSFDQVAGTFVYTPDANYNGDDSFTIVVTDGSGSTTEQVVSVTVNAVNDDPTVAATNSVTTDEDTVSSAVLIGASDIDGDTLTYSVKTGGEPAHGSVSFDQLAGTFTFTPAADYNGGDSFTILISDGNGGTTEQVVTVTVNAVNDAAVIGGDTDADITEDADPNTVSGTLTASDVDNTPNNFQASSGTTTYGSFTMAANGAWVYTLDNTNAVVDALGSGSPLLTDIFTVKSEDGTEQTVTVSIHGVDDVVTVTLPETYDGLDSVYDHDSDTGGAVNNSATIQGDNQANDNITGGSANQNIDGKGGNDTIYGGGGADDITGNNGDDHLYGQAGNDTINGNNGLDEVYGGSGGDTITGGGDADTIYGGSGNDTINGSGGNDIVIGGYGADNLTGEVGDDIFRFLDKLDTNDTITDFRAAGAGNDQLDLNGIDADEILDGNQDFAWGGDDGPIANGLWFSYDAGTNTTTLFGDTDGNLATAEFMLTLQNFNGFAAYGDASTQPPITLIDG